MKNMLNAYKKEKDTQPLINCPHDTFEIDILWILCFLWCHLSASLIVDHFVTMPFILIISLGLIIDCHYLVLFLFLCFSRNKNMRIFSSHQSQMGLPILPEYTTQCTFPGNVSGKFASLQMFCNIDMTSKIMTCPQHV